MWLIWFFQLWHCNDRSIRFEANCDLTRINIQNVNILKMVLADHRAVQWVEGKLSALRYEIGAFKRAVQRIFAPHCSSGLHTLKFHLLDPLVENLERLGSMSFPNTVPFENCKGQAKQS